MTTIPLKDEQKQYLIELDKLFDKGLADEWIVIEERGEVDHIKPKTGDLRPPLTTRAFLFAFADARLLELRTSDSGQILFCRFRVNDIKRAIENGWQDTPVPITLQSPKYRTAWANGSFFLFTFVVVIVLLAIVANTVSWLALPLVLIAGIIFVPLIGIFQLRQDEKLSQKNFGELLQIVLAQLPFIKQLAKNDQPQD